MDAPKTMEYGRINKCANFGAAQSSFQNYGEAPTGSKSVIGTIQFFIIRPAMNVGLLETSSEENGLC